MGQPSGPFHAPRTNGPVPNRNENRRCVTVGIAFTSSVLSTATALIVVIVIGAAVGAGVGGILRKLFTGGRCCLGGRAHFDGGGLCCTKQVGQSSLRRRSRRSPHSCGRSCVRSYRRNCRKPRCQGATRSGWRRLYFLMIGHGGGACVSDSSIAFNDHLSYVPWTHALMI